MTTAAVAARVHELSGGYFAPVGTSGGFVLFASRRKADLPAAMKEWLIADLAAGLPGYAMRDYFESQPTLFADFDHLVIACEAATGKVVGYMGVCWLTVAAQRILYVWSTVVVTRLQRSGLFRPLLAWALFEAYANTDQPPSYLCLKTTNPVVYRCLAFFRRVLAEIRIFPDLTSATQPADLAALARDIAATQWPDLTWRDPGVLLNGMGAAAQAFYPELPRSGHPATDAFFAEHVGIDDQLLVVAAVPPAARAALAALLDRLKGA